MKLKTEGISLIEAAHMLFTAMGNDDPTMYRSFIVEVMAALMTPEVTKDFEHYCQKNAAKLLKNLHSFL